MNNDQSQPIFPESPEAASFQTGLSGWVDRHGRFWGKDEQTARYCGSTHKHCDCGAVIKQRSFCEDCSRLKEAARYKEVEKLTWNGETPLYSQIHDKYLFGKDDLLDLMQDSKVTDPDELELFLCEPNYLREIESDQWCDDLPDDGDLPPEVEAALEVFNAVLRAAEPVSWSPGKFAAIVDLEIDFK